jgi:hypothetical protein
LEKMGRVLPVCRALYPPLPSLHCGAGCGGHSLKLHFVQYAPASGLGGVGQLREAALLRRCLPHRGEEHPAFRSHHGPLKLYALFALGLVHQRTQARHAHFSHPALLRPVHLGECVHDLDHPLQRGYVRLGEQCADPLGDHLRARALAHQSGHPLVGDHAGYAVDEPGHLVPGFHSGPAGHR